MASLLSRDRWEHLEPLLDAALELTPERRDAFVNGSCSGDDALRAELRALLAEYATHDVLLDRPAAERFASLLDDDLSRLPSVLSDRYRIERELGRGGMAVVYLADDLRHERQVAIKVLRPKIAAALGAERFLAEIKLTAQLQHANILPLHDSGEAGGFLFYVTPYLEDGSLRQRLEREKQLSIDTAVRLTCEVASALEAAHRRGVVHRDIKPENILLHDGTALVADFGIALALSEASPRVPTPELALGTPQYMSPEHAAGDGPIDSRTDIYALGTVLYEMLTGEVPFTGTSAAEIIAMRSATPAPSPRVLRPAVPASIDAVVSRALSREPADRYRTAGDFAEALKTALVEHSADQSSRRQPGMRRRRLMRSLGAVAVVTVGLAGAAIARSWNSSARPGAIAAPDTVKSIAVLPLVTVGNDTANSYFAEGMGDFLSSALGNVAGIRVISTRTTAFLFTRGRSVDFRSIGQQLGVTMLLQGSVLRAGEQLQVPMSLVSAQTGRTVWSHTYRHELREAKDLFAVQDDIVKDVVSQLRITLSAGQQRAPTHPHTENLEALDLYEQGQSFLDKRSPDGVERARQYFERAIATDSNLAEAYTGLAAVYTTYAIGNLGDYEPTKYYPLARDFAQRALAIDSASADAHAYMGAVKCLYEFDWAGADRDISRALAIDPRSSIAHLWRVTLLEFTRRFGEAAKEARAGLDLEPQSLYATIELGRALFFDKQYDQAVVQLRRVIERDSMPPRAHMLLGQVYEHTNRLDSAVVEMEAAVRNAPESSRALAFLAHAYALNGRRTDALRELGVLRQRALHAYVPAFDFAVAYAGLGLSDETFTWLGKAFDDRSLRPYLMDPTFDSIRSDPRYQSLLRKLHLPAAARAG
jgi:serine/threonine-protein kinase